MPDQGMTRPCYKWRHYQLLKQRFHYGHCVADLGRGFGGVNRYPATPPGTADTSPPRAPRVASSESSASGKPTTFTSTNTVTPAPTVPVTNAPAPILFCKLGL